jgi:hypothetical protein
MRRGVGVYLLLGIGVFLLVLAPLVRFVVYPKAAKLPLDPYTVTPLTGSGGTYVDRSTGNLVTGANITAWEETRGDVESGNSSRMVWEGVTTTVVSDGQSLPKTNDRGEVTNLMNDIARTRVPMDRKTGEAIACCGEQPTGHDRSLTFNFPMGTKKQTYRFWDDTISRPGPVQYVRTVHRGGMRLYEFFGTVPPAKMETLDVPSSTVGRPAGTSVRVDQYYENTERRLWVEPRTGAIVDAVTHPFVTLRDPATGQTLATAFDVRLKMAEKIPDSVRAEAKASNQNPDLADALYASSDLRKRAGDGAAQLRLISTILPLAGLLLGLVLIVLAVLLLRGRNRRGQHRLRTPEPDDSRDDTREAPVTA